MPFLSALTDNCLKTSAFCTLFPLSISFFAFGYKTSYQGYDIKALILAKSSLCWLHVCCGKTSLIQKLVFAGPEQIDY